VKEKLERDRSNLKKESCVGNNALCSKNAGYKIKVAGKSRAQSQTFLIYTHIFIFSLSNLFNSNIHQQTTLNIQQQFLALYHHDRKRHPQYDEGQKNKRNQTIMILFCKLSMSSCFIHMFWTSYSTLVYSCVLQMRVLVMFWSYLEVSWFVCIECNLDVLSTNECNECHCFSF